jgi:hypothetical protein
MINERHRLQWVAMLAKLVAPMDATAAAKALADMLPMLADFPDAAFSIGSLQAIAGSAKRTPTYADLRRGLGAWWHANRGDMIADTSSAKDADADWKAKQRREHAEAKADWSDPAKVRRSRDLVLSSPIRQLEFGRMLAALVSKHAPINLGLLPPEWIAEDEGRAAA